MLESTPALSVPPKSPLKPPLDLLYLVSTCPEFLEAIVNIMCAKDASLMAISSDAAIQQRDTALLQCVGYSSAATVSITWTFNNQPVANSALVTIYEQQIGILNARQSLLQFCSASISQSGVYTCTVSDGQVSIQNTTRLTISGMPLMFCFEYILIC